MGLITHPHISHNQSNWGITVGKSDNEHDEHKDGDESSQHALLSDKGITNASIDPQLALVNKIFLPKWFAKVKIVVSPDYHFTVATLQ